MLRDTLSTCLSSLAQVFLNGQRLPIKTFQEYVDQYLGPKENGVPRIYERFGDRWEVCISTTEGQFQQASEERRRVYKSRSTLSNSA